MWLLLGVFSHGGLGSHVLHSQLWRGGLPLGTTARGLHRSGMQRCAFGGSSSNVLLRVLSHPLCLVCLGPGGWPSSAMNFLRIRGGSCTAASYPYTSGTTAAGGTCKACTPLVTVGSVVQVPPKNDAAMQAAVFKQPVSVAVEANQQGFYYYAGGIFTGPCGASLDHAVLVYGYACAHTALYVGHYHPRRSARECMLCADMTPTR